MRYGNWIVTDETYRTDIKTLMGLASDVANLPKASSTENFDLATGSTAYCLDTGDTYIYYEITDTWYKQ